MELAFPHISQSYLYIVNLFFYKNLKVYIIKRMKKYHYFIILFYLKFKSYKYSGIAGLEH